jgi:hypothetical protein
MTKPPERAGAMQPGSDGKAQLSRDCPSGPDRQISWAGMSTQYKRCSSGCQKGDSPNCIRCGVSACQFRRNASVDIGGVAFIKMKKIELWTKKGPPKRAEYPRRSKKQLEPV